MEMPEQIPVSNVERAFGAILRLISRFPELSPCHCPGLGTGVGGVSPDQAAEVMVNRYQEWRD